LTTINIHTDRALKDNAQDVFDNLGLDMSATVNLFFRHVAYGEVLPFEADKRVAFEKEGSENSKKFKFGGWEGKISMPDDFNARISANG
jgi:addiction module RelB/DinJ family antitoxin